MATQDRVNTKERIGSFRLAAFVSPFAPIFGGLLPVTAYAPTFYATDIGLGLGFVGTVFMLARFWDVFSDPIFGVISDNFPTRFGRRRPWLVAGAPLLMLSTYLLFIPGETVSGVYLTVWLLAFYTGLTLTLMSMYAWAMELSPEYHERSRIMAYAQAAMIVGSIAVILLPTLVISYGQGAGGPIPSGLVMQVMAWFLIALLPLSLLLCLRSTGEPANPPPATDTSWLDSAKTLVTNGSMLRIVLADLLGTFANGITLVGTVLYTIHVLGLSIIDASQMLLAGYVMGFGFIPIWTSMSERIGKHNTMLAAALFLAAVSIGLLLFLPVGNLFCAIVGWALLGISPGALQFLPRAILSDIVDQDRAILGGPDRSGMYFAFLSMSLKLGFGLSVGVFFPLLEVIGFSPAGQNSPDVLNDMSRLFFLLPAASSVLIAGLMWKFPIDVTEQRRLRAIVDSGQG